MQPPKPAPVMKVLTDGSEVWQLGGHLHREDGPAVTLPDGTREWYINGRHHRADGPAIEWSNGVKEWFLHGLLHRTDGPAVEKPGGGSWWYQNGQHHRIGGPAIETVDGSKWWYQNGKLHREDGPAIEKPDGTKQWWLEGRQLGEAEFRDWHSRKRAEEDLKRRPLAFSRWWRENMPGNTKKEEEGDTLITPAEVFCPDKWVGKTGEMQQLWEKIPADAKPPFDFAAALAEARQKTLKTRAGRTRHKFGLR